MVVVLVFGERDLMQGQRTAVMREVFPLPAGPTRRNVGRVVVALERNITM